MNTKLLSEKTTPGQLAVIGSWYANLLVVVVLWATTSASLITEGGAGGVFLAIGRLLGLLATVFALTQFMLMGRILWIERKFGLDHLAAYHRLNGYGAIILILIHAPFVILGYSLTSHTNYVKQYIEVALHYPYVPFAIVSVLLFSTVVGASIYIVRRHLKFETWYYVHLIAYSAIVLASLHQFAVGGSLIDHPLARTYWFALYGFVAVSVLFWRFTLPTFNLLRFQFKVDEVIAETATTTSVYIKGKGLSAWAAQPGQFVLVRFLNRQFGWQEHPFSLSALPHDNRFRLTIRHSGDYTNAIGELKLGTPVLVSGPYGRFTDAIALTNRRLFIAGGVGITPIRTLLEQAAANKHDSVLVYGNRTPDDVVFEKELQAIAGVKIIDVFSDPAKDFKGETGYVSAELIARTVPDYKKRDIYLCGPPVMMDSIVAGLLKAGFPAAQLHFEKFALHN